MTTLKDKIKLFYKLALYGDRADYLDKAAQVLPAGPSDLVPSLVPKPVQPTFHNSQWSDLKPKTQTLPETTITGDVLKGKDLYDLFTRVYRALKTGQPVSEQDKDYWTANSKVFKDRSNALKNMIAKEETKDGGGNPYQMDQWKAEMDAINFVFSKQV